MKDMLNLMNAYILSGGHSRRFGEDKALYIYKGKPLIAYQIERFADHFNELAIVTKDASPYSDLGHIVLEDILPYQTPLAGIYTGLCHTDSNWNFFVACDMPMVTIEIVNALTRGIPAAPAGLEIIIPQTPQGLQPLAALYHKSLADVFIKTAEKARSVKDFIRSRNTKIIDFKTDKFFTNVNTKEQLQEFD